MTIPRRVVPTREAIAVRADADHRARPQGWALARFSPEQPATPTRGLASGHVSRQRLTTTHTAGSGDRARHRPAATRFDAERLRQEPRRRRRPAVRVPRPSLRAGRPSPDEGDLAPGARRRRGLTTSTGRHRLLRDVLGEPRCREPAQARDVVAVFDAAALAADRPADALVPELSLCLRPRAGPSGGCRGGLHDRILRRGARLQVRDSDLGLVGADLRRGLARLAPRRRTSVPVQRRRQRLDPACGARSGPGSPRTAAFTGVHRQQPTDVRPGRRRRTQSGFRGRLRHGARLLGAGEPLLRHHTDQS